MNEAGERIVEAGDESCIALLDGVGTDKNAVGYSRAAPPLAAFIGEGEGNEDGENMGDEVEGEDGYSGEKANRLCRLVGGAGEKRDGLEARRLDTAGVDSADEAEETLAVAAEEVDISRREGGTNGLSVERLW